MTEEQFAMRLAIDEILAGVDLSGPLHTDGVTDTVPYSLSLNEQLRLDTDFAELGAGEMDALIGDRDIYAVPEREWKRLARQATRAAERSTVH